MTVKPQNTEYFYMNSAEVLDASFGIYKRSFWEQLLLYFCFSMGVSVVVFVPLYFIFMYIYVVVLIGLFAGGGDPSSLIGVVLLLIVSVSFVVSATSGLITCGNFFMSKQIFYGEKKALGKVFSSALKSIPKSLLAGLARGIISLVPILFLLPVIFNISDIFTDAMLPVTIICIGLFVLSYLFLDTLLVYANYAAINDNKLFFGAVGKGISLIKGSFWRTFGIRLIMQTLVTLLTYSLTFGVQFGVQTVSDIAADPGIFVLVMIFQYLLSFIISVLTGPLFVILDSALYFNQKLKKDGLDLEIKLSRLEGGSL